MRHLLNFNIDELEDKLRDDDLYFSSSSEIVYKKIGV
jgi:hypothetical protein